MEKPITIWDDIRFYLAAFIGGILIGALIYRELEKRFFSQRSIPLGIVIEQSVIRDRVKSLIKLEKTLSNVVIKLQEDVEAIFSQLNRIADLEEEIMEIETPSSPKEQPASESEEMEKALENLFDKE